MKNMEKNYCFFFNLFLFKAGVDQKRLLAGLFKNYNPLERPCLNESQSVRVELGISIQQIVDVVRIILNLSY